MSDRQGIEIDYYPKCRGVWLDRGKLDKIIERNVGSAAPSGEPRESWRPDPRRSDSDHDDRHGRHRPKKKRGGFLSERSSSSIEKGGDGPGSRRSVLSRGSRHRG